MPHPRPFLQVAPRHAIHDDVCNLAAGGIVQTAAETVHVLCYHRRTRDKQQQRQKSTTADTPFVFIHLLSLDCTDSANFPTTMGELLFGPVFGASHTRTSSNAAGRK